MAVRLIPTPYQRTSNARPYAEPPDPLSPKKRHARRAVGRRDLSVLSGSFPPILHKKLATGVSLRPISLLVYPKNPTLKTAVGTCQGMAGGDPARQKAEESCRIVRLFNDAGHRLTPLQAANPYAQPPKGCVFSYKYFRRNASFSSAIQPSR